jgi:hypothetical protein
MEAANSQPGVQECLMMTLRKVQGIIHVSVRLLSRGLPGPISSFP